LSELATEKAGKAPAIGLGTIGLVPSNDMVGRSDLAALRGCHILSLHLFECSYEHCWAPTPLARCRAACRTAADPDHSLLTHTAPMALNALNTSAEGLAYRYL
jgi:hypothetical protein